MVELPPAVYVKLVNGFEVAEGSKTYNSMSGIVYDVTAAERQGSMTFTPAIVHCAHELRFSVTHATTFMS